MRNKQLFDRSPLDIEFVTIDGAADIETAARAKYSIYYNTKSGRRAQKHITGQKAARAFCDKLEGRFYAGECDCFFVLFDGITE